jgi:hypothetical protein
MLNWVVHTVTTVLQSLNILIPLPSELPHYAATVVGDHDVSILCRENGRTRVLWMFVTTHQATCCNTHKTTEFAFTSCTNFVTFLGDLCKSSVSEATCLHHYGLMWRLTWLHVVFTCLACSWSFQRICPNLRTCATFSNTSFYSDGLLDPHPDPNLAVHDCSG